MSESLDYEPAVLIARARAMSTAGRRFLLGVTGAPGAGKSTLAEMLVTALGPMAALVALDGFHLADPELARLGRSDRKGAPDTFDRAGFAAALRRLRAGEETVYLPRFHREIEAAIAGEVAIDPQSRLLVVEGNYLLHWPEIHAELDEVWYLDPPDDQRVALLIARHIEFGRPPDVAREWVLRSDQANAALIAAGRDRADRIIRARVWPPSV